MTLTQFRILTAHLEGDMELLCAGADIGLLWHDDRAVSIDNDASYPLEGEHTVLHRDDSGYCDGRFDIDYIIHREHEFAPC